MTRIEHRFAAGLVLLIGGICQTSNASGAEPKSMKVRITGLFSPDREADLRALFKQWPEIELASVEFNHAEADIKLDAAKVFPGTKPNDVIARLDDKVRNASNGTFGVKQPSSVARDKLKRIEIPVAGLDCKACCLAAYEIVARIDGVEQATASFKEGRITALIDPIRTDKAALEDALKKRGVTLKRP